MVDAIVLILGIFTVVAGGLATRALVRRELTRRGAKPLSVYEEARRRWIETGDAEAKEIMYRTYKPDSEDE